MSSLFDNEVFVFVSGGKDSTATLLLALEQYPKEKVVPFFSDTGWEHPETYKYLDYLEEKLDIKVHHHSTFSVPDLIRKYKRFPSARQRFCTSESKIRAAYNWFKLRGYYQSGEAQAWYGIRVEESFRRKQKYGELDEKELLNYHDLYPSAPKKLSRHIRVRLPVLYWTEQQVFDFIASKGIKRNPLYDEGTNDRVGCYPCMLASRKIQEKMFSTPFGQERLSVIRKLEEEIGEKYKMYDTDQGSCEVCKI